MSHVNVDDTPTRVGEMLETVRQDYAEGANRPLGTYLVLMSAYLVGVAGLGWSIRRKGVPLPKRMGPMDLVVLAAATHKVSRLLAKDPVTSPLRAPFTRFRGTSGPAELKEDVREEPVRKGIGELITCPFCLGQWVATALVGGSVLAPRATGLVSDMFAALAAADMLQFAYSAAEQAVE